MRNLMHVLKFVMVSVAMLPFFGGVAHAQYITSPVTQAARNAPTGALTPEASDRFAADRVEALELRLSRMEQLLEAQRTLQARQNRNQAMKLNQRLDRLESLMSGMTGDAASGAQSAAASVSATTPTASPNNALGSDVQTRLNDVTEALRMLQAQTDELMIEMRGMSQRVTRGQADSEFRFQALESGVRRATAGISSVSDEPEVIGFVKRSAPVQGLEAASAGKTSAGVDVVATRLVGEGDLSVLTEFGASGRTPLDDPKKLYQRGLKDLQAGDYGGAQVDFAKMLEKFPNHALAGNAQYWLGETFYVRRQYKQAAQAFLAGYTTYAESAKAPDSLLKLGMTLTALGEKKTGCDAFAELGAKFPDAPNAIAKRAQIERKRAGCAS